MAGIRLSKEDFLKSFELVPRPAVSLLIKNQHDEFLLAKRSYPPFEGEWYLPGSFIMKNETLLECITRVAKDELGLTVDPKKAKLLGVFEMITEDARGHALDLEYELVLDENTLKTLRPQEEVEFFAALPTPLFPGHKRSLEQLGYE